MLRKTIHREQCFGCFDVAGIRALGEDRERVNTAKSARNLLLHQIKLVVFPRACEEVMYGVGVVLSGLDLIGEKTSDGVITTERD